MFFWAWALLHTFSGHDGQGVPGDDDLLVRGDHHDIHLAVLIGDDDFLAVDRFFWKSTWPQELHNTMTIRRMMRYSPRCPP